MISRTVFSKFSPMTGADSSTDGAETGAPVVSVEAVSGFESAGAASGFVSAVSTFSAISVSFVSVVEGVVEAATGAGADTGADVAGFALVT